MSFEDSYKPPYQLTDEIIFLISEISELIGRYSVLAESSLTPQLRRENRIKTIQASLQIENNSLSVEQVTAVLEGKRVLGLPREIQEVRNAFAAYELLDDLNLSSIDDLLRVHQTLMHGLADDAGKFRQGSVGIYQGEKVVHMAPQAHMVQGLMEDLFAWLEQSTEHPLVTSCVFHYEFEFIHPFSDGNGRMGRLWQTLILKQWKPLLAYLPVETLINEQQQGYYDALAQSDKAAASTPFMLFMLKSIKSALEETQV